tara:strand:+ start:204 stop:1163 length:960 start_codon:yes stop_codon:yes gene_type:complete
MAHHALPANGFWSRSFFEQRAQNVHVHFSGVSESRNLLEEGLPLWKCQGGLRYTIERSTNRDLCQRNEEWSERHNGTFLAACREGFGVQEAGGCDPLKTVSISWSWKHGMQPSSNDRRAVELIRERRDRKRAIAVFSALPMPSWSESTDGATLGYDTREEVSDAWAPPTGAMGHWLDGAEQLFRFLARELRPHACVVWKGNHVGSRDYPVNRTTSGGEARHHHASSQGGMHDWMNRVAFALARRHGIATLDMTPLTVGQTSSAAWAGRWGERLAEGKVDLHHWYSGLWRPVMTGLLKLCDEHCGWLPPHAPSMDCGSKK